MAKGIFIAATGQDVGKTTTCLGLVSGLLKTEKHLGFIKPVGQRHLEVSSGLHVDKDVILFKEQFELNCEYQDMSPVLIPQGFTKDFLDGKYQREALLKKITSSYEKIAKKSSFVVVEGTGHSGVGSIIGLNNAQVAKELGLEMLLVTSGGLGSAFDSLCLNLALCKQYSVKVRGIILNRVKDDKKVMIEEYFPQALKTLALPLIGCIPYNPLLRAPSMQDFSQLLQSPLISGEEKRFRHYQSTRLVATSLEAFLELLKPKQLIITPGAREDIILASIQEERKYQEKKQKSMEGGLILTGRYPPKKTVLEAIKNSRLPCIYAPIPSYEAMKKITSFVAKIRIGDLSKIEAAIELVEKHIDFSFLL